MAYIEFHDQGYECYDGEHRFLFSENNSHERLFRYITQDLSRLPELLEKYVDLRMDTTTFELRNCTGSDALINQMKDVLIALHPYHEHEIRDLLIKEVGSYFNDLLLYSYYCLHITIPDFSEAWYRARIEKLLEPLLELGDTYPGDFYQEYRNRSGNGLYTAGQPESEIEFAIYDVPRKRPIGFSREIMEQNEINKMLYFLLDISAQGLNELTTPQRMWFYSNIMANIRENLTISKLFFFKHQTLPQIGNDYGSITEHNPEVDDKFCPLQALSKVDIAHDGIPASMEGDFHSAIEYVKTVAIEKPYEVYKIQTLYQLLYLEIWTMIQDKVMIRKCRYCGKYFVVADRRTAYCDRVNESGLRCSAIGYQQTFKKKMETDEALQIYNRAYKTHHARVRKGTMSRESLREWCVEAKDKLEKARRNELEIDEFREWLKK